MNNTEQKRPKARARNLAKSTFTAGRMGSRALAPAVLLLGLAAMASPDIGLGLIGSAQAAGDSHTGGTTHTGPSSHTGGTHSGGRYGRPSHAGSGHDSGEHDTGEHDSAEGDHEKGKKGKGKAGKGRGHDRGIAMGHDGGQDLEAGVFRYGGRTGGSDKDHGGDDHGDDHHSDETGHDPGEKDHAVTQ